MRRWLRRGALPPDQPRTRRAQHAHHVALDVDVARAGRTRRQLHLPGKFTAPTGKPTFESSTRLRATSAPMPPCDVGGAEVRVSMNAEPLQARGEPFGI